VITKVGIIGTGFAAGVHAEALRRLPQVQLVAVASRDPQRAQAFAGQHGVARAHASYAELITDGEVESVHVCASNDAHAECTAGALRAGKHVLCEKPLGIDSSETALLVELAEEAARRQVVAGVCFNYRFFALVRDIRERLHSGVPGPAHFVHGAYLQDWLLEETDWSWRVDPSVVGTSRAMADIGSHWCDLAQFLLADRIASVFADVGVLHDFRIAPSQETETFARPSGDGSTALPVAGEDFATVILRFENGAHGTLILSQVSAGRKNGLTIEIDAKSAAFAWNQEDPDRAWVGARKGHNVELVRDPATLSGDVAALSHNPAGHVEGWTDAFRNLVEDFYASVAAARDGRAHESSFATLAEAHRLVELVEAVAASHRLGQWIDVGQLVPVSR
jgi:predicted dehydrogenase